MLVYIVYVTLNLSLSDGETQILEHSRNGMSDLLLIISIRHIGIRVDLINRCWGFDRSLWTCFPRISQVLSFLLFSKV